MKKKTLLGILACLFFSVASQAQIGYQVALLNSATGEPRANETVKAEITITDAKNGIVCSETQSVTSNDFGILSFTVGNADTFKDVALGRLPLFISVTVNDVLIGKSQILSVPVAEVANTLKSDFTLDELCKTWVVRDDQYFKNSYVFEKDGSFVFYHQDKDSQHGYIKTFRGSYEIEGNSIYLFFIDKRELERYNSIPFIRWRNGTLDFCLAPTDWGGG